MRNNSSVFDRLMAISEQSAETGHFEVAYHALAAAQHAAVDAGDVRALERVGELCDQQARMVERIEPPHRLSQAAAERRGTHSTLYQSLRMTVEASRARMLLDQRRSRGEEGI